MSRHVRDRPPEGSRSESWRRYLCRLIPTLEPSSIFVPELRVSMCTPPIFEFGTVPTVCGQIQEAVVAGPVFVVAASSPLGLVLGMLSLIDRHRVPPFDSLKQAATSADG